MSLVCKSEDVHNKDTHTHTHAKKNTLACFCTRAMGTFSLEETFLPTLPSRARDAPAPAPAPKSARSFCFDGEEGVDKAGSEDRAGALVFEAMIFLFWGGSWRVLCV